MLLAEITSFFLKLTPMVRLETAPTGFGCSGEIRKSCLSGGGLIFSENIEFSRVICYDVSGVERTYQFLLQCLQWDVRVAADKFRGCHAPFLLGRSAGR